MKILLHDGNNNVIKGLNKYLIKYLHGQNDIQVLFSNFHNRLLGVYQSHTPNIVVWPVSEYTQEVHDFITEYHLSTKILLVIDVDVAHKDLYAFWNKTPNIKTIVNTKLSKQDYNNKIAQYISLYDDEIFKTDTTISRNNKIVAILSSDNNKNNELLSNIVYPYNKYPIVAVNNPEFDSPINLGVVNYVDLSFIFKTFSKVIDIDRQYEIECHASDIDYINIYDYSIDNAIENNHLVPKITNIDEYGLSYFVKDKVLPYFKA